MPTCTRHACWIVSLILLLTSAQVQAAGETQERLSKNSLRATWDFQGSNFEKFKNVWTPVDGKWSIMAEPERPSNRVLRQADVKREYQHFASKQNYANFIFSARMRTDATQYQTRNWQTGILFRWASENEYYKLRITAANIALSRASGEVEEAPAADGTPSPSTLTPVPLAEENATATTATGTALRVRSPNKRNAKIREEMLMILPLGAAPNQWHTLTVACKGERITLALDGREIRTLTDPGLGCGKLGLFAYKTQAFFDDLQLDYEKLPEFAHGLKIASDVFRPMQDRELLIYYKNPKTGPLEMRILDDQKQPFVVLTRDPHREGLNSITWDGMNMAGQRPRPGRYTIELNIPGSGKRYAKQVTIEM